MDQICIQIQMEQTGKHIRKLLMENGYSVRDIQHAMGFSSATFWTVTCSSSMTWERS